MFAGANVAVPGSYEIVVASPAGGEVRGDGPIRLSTERLDPSVPVDTLVIAGGPATRRDPADDALIATIGALARGARRAAAVCTGSLLLARTGLLDGRRATTHWAAAATLARRHPAITVDPYAIYVRDGKFWTSAGVTAGMDLALALVADDVGEHVASEIARWLVMFVRRPGGQSQFSSHLSVPTASTASIRAVQGWLADHLADDLSNPALARRAGLSERHFTRRFRQEVGLTPAAFVNRVRIDHARRLLCGSDASLTEIARGCGFGTVQTLHRASRRAVGTTPEQYRQHFATTESKEP